MSEHLHDPSDNWNTYDNKFANPKSNRSGGSSIGLAFLIAIILGMFFYIGSFYMDRKPLPEVSKKQKQNESHYDQVRFPGFERHSG